MNPYGTWFVLKNLSGFSNPHKYHIAFKESEICITFHEERKFTLDNDEDMGDEKSSSFSN